MKVLIIGKGGREHALAWKAKESPLVREVFVAPGNVGMSEVATLVPISDMEPEKLVEWAKENKIGLTIVGPEASLALGVVDLFLEAKLPVWGATQKAAEIESSKDFSKQMMVKYGAPTAYSETFTTIPEAHAYMEKIGLPLVIKADGLAAGKGVIIPTTMAEAKETVTDMLSGNRFGAAGSRILIEEMLEGEEFSLMTFVHNGQIIPMPIAQDHKRAYDNDQGPNTGGMGAYAPIYGVESDEVTTIVETIMRPVVDGLIKEGRSYTGFLYGGLFKTAEGFKVIEFNARFGDPEAQVILPLLKTDMIALIMAMLNETPLPKIEWREEFAVGVVLAAEGYPDNPNTGHPLKRVTPDNQETIIYYAGVTSATKRGDNERANSEVSEVMNEGALLSAGGRILLATSIAPTFKDAQTKVYKVMKTLEVPHTFYRKDIGDRHLKRQ